MRANPTELTVVLPKKDGGMVAIWSGKALVSALGEVPHASGSESAGGRIIAMEHSATWNETSA
jgi:hypothetical protein